MHSIRLPWSSSVVNRRVGCQLVVQSARIMVCHNTLCCSRHLVARHPASSPHVILRTDHPVYRFQFAQRIFALPNQRQVSFLEICCRFAISLLGMVRYHLVKYGKAALAERSLRPTGNRACSAVVICLLICKIFSDSKLTCACDPLY